MNRSKIFLGVTTGLLAVVGVAAAKRFTSNVSRWYCTQGVAGTRHCAPVLKDCVPTTEPSPLTCTYTFSLGGNSITTIVYTQGALQNGQPAPCFTGGNCIQTLFYRTREI